MESVVPEGIEPETWHIVKSYFTDQKWRKIGPYLQKRNCNLFENYKLFLSLGFENVQKPFYMCAKNIPIPDSDGEDDDDDEVGKNNDSEVNEGGGPKSSTYVKPQKAQNISNKTDETVGLTVNASVDVCEYKTPQLKKRRGDKASTSINPENINHSNKRKNEAEALINAGLKRPGERPQKLVIPKHLDNIREPLYVIDLDNYSTNDEHDDEFQGFTEQEFKLSVISFNFFQRVKTNVEDEIVKANHIKENGNFAETNKILATVENKEHTEVKSTEGNKKADINFHIDESKSYYHKRNIPTINYREEDAPDDDEFVYCDECEIEREGPDCPIHGLLVHIPDSIVDAKIAKSEHNAEASVPHNLKVAQSSLPDKNAGQGVWSLTTIPARSFFGPYRGKKVDKKNVSGYSWEITENRRPIYCVDAVNPRYGNWMRFVNCARHADEQNVVAYQYKRQIYYRTFEDIPPHNELLVFYGDHYAKQLGVSLEEFKKKRTEPLKRRGFICSFCKTSFCSPIYKERHESLYCLKNTHSEDTTRRYICGDCGKRFTWKINLERHTTTHSGFRPHECNVCGKTFSVKCNLKEHISCVHNRERRFKCDVCYKCFATRRYLTIHKRVHDKLKPYHCDICYKKFTLLGHLKDHLKVHTGERPYKCNECNKSFNVKCNLKTHMRLHTGEKPYSCMYCDMKFSDMSGRNRHVKKKHNM